MILLCEHPVVTGCESAQSILRSSLRRPGPPANVTNDGRGNLPTYDDENRIATDAGYTYNYDADGARIEKTSGTAGTMYWLGPGGESLAETDLSSNVNEEYVYFSGERIARVDRPSGNVYYYYSNHLGSASVITGATGVVVEQTDYFPYGGVAYQSGTDPNHYKFTGKERDSESGFDNFGARYFASGLGRFMTPDWAPRPAAVPYAVFGDPQSLNLYTYVRNDPVTRADTDGHAGQRCYQDMSEDARGRVCVPVANKPGGPIDGPVEGWWAKISSALTFSKSANLVNETDKDKSVGLVGNTKIVGGSVSSEIGNGKVSADVEIHGIKTELNFSSNADGSKGAANGQVTNNYLAAEAGGHIDVAEGAGAKAEAQVVTFGGSLNIGRFTVSGSICAICVGAQAKAGLTGISAGLEPGLVGADFSIKWGTATVLNQSAEQ